MFTRNVTLSSFEGLTVIKFAIVNKCLVDFLRSVMSSFYYPRYFNLQMKRTFFNEVFRDVVDDALRVRDYAWSGNFVIDECASKEVIGRK